jgi:hypothetical protein
VVSNTGVFAFAGLVCTWLLWFLSNHQRSARTEKRPDRNPASIFFPISYEKPFTT